VLWGVWRALEVLGVIAGVVAPAFAVYALYFVRPSIEGISLSTSSGFIIGGGPPGIGLAFGVSNANLLTLRDVQVICRVGPAVFGPLRDDSADLSKRMERMAPGTPCERIAAERDWTQAGNIVGDVRRLGDIPPFDERRAGCNLALGSNVSRAEIGISIGYILNVIWRVPWRRRICIDREMLRDENGNVRWSPIP
jgi:hypothetical protein